MLHLPGVQLKVSMMSSGGVHVADSVFTSSHVAMSPSTSVA